MCPPDSAPPRGDASNLKKIVGVLALTTTALLISTIVLATNQSSPSPAPADDAQGLDVKANADPVPAPFPEEPASPAEPVIDTSGALDAVVDEPVAAEAPDDDAEEDKWLSLKALSSFYDQRDTVCAGKKLQFDNQPCVDLEVAPQAGANVTRGYVGSLDVGDIVPNTEPYWKSSMCPVNVHWHLGAEHYSAGQYDEDGDGPHGNAARPDWADRERSLAEGDVRDGFRCRHYDADDEKFTKAYEWKHCVGMEVGETYEVHWPHSAAGACGTVDQYNSPFEDGLFCNLDMDSFLSLKPQQVASAVGVQGQVFTIVNDESYYYGDMIRGMIVDKDMGNDVAIYTGSSTGASRDNEMCSMYNPVTWQVDRKCHMISASSFDKMCFDMKTQRDDMSGDLYAHGSRELVRDEYAANNQHYPEAKVEAPDAPAEEAPAAEAPAEEAPAAETAAAVPPAAEAPAADVAAGDPVVEGAVVEPANRDLAGETADEASRPPSFLDHKSLSSMYSQDDNACAGAKLAFDNELCVNLEVAPQAGANVTEGYVGSHDVGDIVPNTKPYFQSGMCPVNVHWHLGAEHYSAGQYDEGGDGPNGNQPKPDWADRARALAEGDVRDGFRCRHYDADDEKFTKAYDWKHCVGMEVGETYEVHWPHSAAGACGTVDQYQTPFEDGVFCNLPMEAFKKLKPQDIASAVGVHGQVFTIVNDESYYYADMMRGMIVDGEMGKDVAIYTGSTTGASRDNVKCSQYTPITWQVDRKCHMISASSFDKLCYDMKMQRDDMSGDLYAHGSRELVSHEYAANNQHYGDRRNLRG